MSLTAECTSCDIIFKLGADQPSVCPKCDGGFVRIITRTVAPYCTCEGPFGCDVYRGTERARGAEEILSALAKVDFGEGDSSVSPEVMLLICAARKYVAGDGQ